ncbi:MAG TPA: restriction endonuclease subunit S [Bryobacteraceae bacterium]|nr:restriction endonuclease subunit S [Bryobacteraceae bacterium]
MAELNPPTPRLSGEMPYVPMEAIGLGGGLCVDTTRNIDQESSGLTYFQDGDVLIAKITPCFENGKCALATGLPDGHAVGTTELHVLRCGPRLRPKFLFYVVQSHTFRQAGEASMTGAAGQKRVTPEFIANYGVLLPDHVEQDAVVDFLNRATLEIDELVAKKQRLIELLEEKRAALISRAVTQGLDAGVPMKDSGVEWLERVPAHWRLGRVKWLARTQSGGTPNSQDAGLYGGEIPWLRTLDLTNGPVSNAPILITEEALMQIAGDVLPTGSVLIAMYGGEGTIGKFGILEIEAAVNQAICAILPCAAVLPTFLGTYIEFYRPFWMADAQGTRRDPNISQDIVRRLMVPLPPVAEQQRIAEYVEREATKLQRIAAGCRATIGRLREYRSALITAAVTGQLDLKKHEKQMEALA